MLDTLNIPSAGRLLAALALLGLTWTGEARASTDDSGNEIRWGNGLKTESLRYNALSTNPPANARMVEVPLHTATYALGTGDAVLRDQLEDPNARDFMEYVVSCALDKGQAVEWTDRLGTSYKWKGEIGLCPAWGSGPASVECQQWVSACVLARNNAYGYRVLLSMRGNHPSTALVPQASLMTDPARRFTRSRVPSMYSCAPESAWGMSRECGYEQQQGEPHDVTRAGSVGRCAPGLPVDLGGGGVPPSACGTSAPLGLMLSGDMVFRVCAGLGACDSDLALAESEGSCGTILPAVTFTCPRSGTFNVMIAPYSSDAAWGAMNLQARGSYGSNARYPAPETEVFSMREGAFFGNLFGSGAVAPGAKVYVDSAGNVHRTVSTVKSSIYPKMFACHDPRWTDGAAYANARLCARPGYNCVAVSVGACNSPSRCESTGADGRYTPCTGSDLVTYSTAITTYLNAPCDVVQNPKICKSN